MRVVRLEVAARASQLCLGLARYGISLTARPLDAPSCTLPELGRPRPRYEMIFPAEGWETVLTPMLWPPLAHGKWEVNNARFSPGEEGQFELASSRTLVQGRRALGQEVVGEPTAD